MDKVLRSSSFGPDYQALWKRLEKTLLELRQGTADSICIASELEKVKVLQGTWGAYGYVWNLMQQLVSEARGDKPKEG